MKFLVTCGPTYEPLDQVRRLTNFSTGKLGIELANSLTDQGHSVTALQGYYSTYRKPCRAQDVSVFTTTGSLLLRLKELSSHPFEALFHAAAVSDFEFGKVYKRHKTGSLEAVTSGKYTTREGTLLAELIPAPKIISELPNLFPGTKIVGWKFEVDGDRESAVKLGQRQVKENRTAYCVVNGPAYGEGYGIVGPEGVAHDCGTPEDLFLKLLETVAKA